MGMSHAEIVAELPKLTAAERAEVWERLVVLRERDLALAEQDLAARAEATETEKALLRQEREAFECSRDRGRLWRESMAQIWAERGSRFSA